MHGNPIRLQIKKKSWKNWPWVPKREAAKQGQADFKGSARNPALILLESGIHGDRLGAEEPRFGRDLQPVGGRTRTQGSFWMKWGRWHKGHTARVGAEALISFDRAREGWHCDLTWRKGGTLEHDGIRKGPQNTAV